MKRTKLKDRVLPTYTKGEEIFNMVSHIVGGALGVITTILAIVIGVIHHNGYGIVSGIIFGISMIFLYTMSSIYHGLSPKKLSKKVMQIIGPLCNICTYSRLIYTICIMYIKRIFTCSWLDYICYNLDFCSIRNNIKCN